MNKAQKAVVLAAVVIVALMLLVPPWEYVREAKYLKGEAIRNAGYAWLFQPPAADDRARIDEAYQAPILNTSEVRVRIDLSRLAIQCGLVAVLAFGACVALARKSEQ